jgi:hypothetical protein
MFVQQSRMRTTQRKAACKFCVFQQEEQQIDVPTHLESEELLKSHTFIVNCKFKTSPPPVLVAAALAAVRFPLDSTLASPCGASFYQAIPRAQRGRTAKGPEMEGGTNT